METAMAYNDIAADKGQEFGDAATKDMTKQAKTVKKEPVKPKKELKASDKPKSFYEELLNEELKKDPNAIAELSKPMELSEQTALQGYPKKQKEDEKTLGEQLWERNNPELARELVMKNESSQKYKDAKEAKEKAANSLGGILGDAGINDENT